MRWWRQMPLLAVATGLFNHGVCCCLVVVRLVTGGSLCRARNVPGWCSTLRKAAVRWLCLGPTTQLVQRTPVTWAGLLFAL